jgi:hypothetical protein
LAFSGQVVDKNHRKALDEKKKVKSNLKSKNEIDCLCQVHELYIAEKRRDISLKCCKILESCEHRGEDDSTRQFFCSFAATMFKTFLVKFYRVVSLIY